MKSNHNNSILNSLVKYLRLKQYQFEVTFCPYVLTPGEKLVFNTILIILLSLFTMLITLYLPLQIESLITRARPYFLGDIVVVDSAPPTRTITMIEMGMRL
ncbi:hypothetical protein EX30DRAFT_373376 [Ascodesmis nigricans]|uniref:Uncharacterized protein n=1 Tax=Ascodesmis nigricans TaxID=341454 RepID=A0A4S2MSK5_9PEZI|nr:hypothetical protein EX30DRAFT_373376 [Ascodesmis nigricans]